MAARVRSASGFTLIEVLIAGVILFMAIATATLLFRGGLTASARAEMNIRVHGNLAQLGNQVHAAMVQGRTDGNGRLAGLTYNWKATLIEERPSRGGLDLMTGESSPGMFQLRLYEVKLEVASAAELGGGAWEFTYREVVW